MAYPLSKSGNQLCVQAAARRRGGKGDRVNSVVPGVISTPLARKQLKSAGGKCANAMIQLSARGRIRTPEEIAGIVEFLAGPESSFITGNDIIVDGERSRHGVGVLLWRRAGAKGKDIGYAMEICGVMLGVLFAYPCLSRRPKTRC